MSNVTVKEKGFKNMENLAVFDAKGVEIGTIKDFSFDRNYQLKSFIVKTKSDTLLAFDVDQIDLITDDKVILNTGTDSLKYDYELQGVRIFRKIKGTKVIGIDDVEVGKIIDAVIHIDNRISFIVGETQGFLSRMGLSGDHDLILPVKHIINYCLEKIEINTSRVDMEVKLNVNKKYNDADIHDLESEYVDIQLFDRSFDKYRPKMV